MYKKHNDKQDKSLTNKMRKNEKIKNRVINTYTAFVQIYYVYV